MKVYKSISDVQAELAVEGISKSKKNTMQDYDFRGIDDVYNALASLLPKHNLVIVPKVIARDCVERINHKGTALFYTTVEAEFDFINIEDGSKHTAKTFGEAMDSGDKSTNKAMSAAYKYACFLTFCIPTEGDHDTENTTHEIDPHKAVSKSPLNPNQIADFSLTIEEAGDMDVLKAAFTAAYRLAQGQGDKAALDKFTKLYNTRKATFEVAA